MLAQQPQDACIQSFEKVCDHADGKHSRLLPLDSSWLCRRLSCSVVCCSDSCWHPYCCEVDASCLAALPLVHIPLYLQTASDYGSYLANEASPLYTSTIVDKCTQKLVDDWNNMRCQVCCCSTAEDQAQQQC
jgi:hypothetical protein